MSTYKVEICGVNTAQLPILKEEEKMTFQKDKSRRQGIQRNLYQGKSPAGIIRDQTV